MRLDLDTLETTTQRIGVHNLDSLIVKWSAQFAGKPQIILTAGSLDSRFSCVINLLSNI